MIQFASIPKALKLRVADPHDPVGRWAHLHPSVHLTLPLPIYRLDSRLRPRLTAWRIFAAMGNHPLVTISIASDHLRHGNIELRDRRDLDDRLIQRLSQTNLTEENERFEPRLIKLPDLHLTVLWLRGKNEVRVIDLTTDRESISMEQFIREVTDRRSEAERRKLGPQPVD